MELLKKYKFILIALAVFAVLSFVYAFYFAGNTNDPLIAGGTSQGPQGVDRELLVLLQSLQSIELDESLFSSPEFRSLSDFGRTLNPEPVGRLNPFAPLQASASRNTF